MGKMGCYGEKMGKNGNVMGERWKKNNKNGKNEFEAENKS